MYRSEATLRYSYKPEYGWRLVAEVDPSIVELARALAPKGFRLNRQRYAPHISVVRHEVPRNIDLWGKREGETVSFLYSPAVVNDDVYYWMYVFSDDLLEVRRELGMSPLSELARPPDLTDCFHVTIGNVKQS